MPGWYKTPAEVELEQLEQTEAEVRRERNGRLAETDYLMFEDYPLDNDAKKALKDYRKALRDVPQQDGFPDNIEWPEKPVLLN